LRQKYYFQLPVINGKMFPLNSGNSFKYVRLLLEHLKNSEKVAHFAPNKVSDG